MLQSTRSDELRLDLHKNGLCIQVELFQSQDKVRDPVWNPDNQISYPCSIQFKVMFIEAY